MWPLKLRIEGGAFGDKKVAQCRQKLEMGDPLLSSGSVGYVKKVKSQRGTFWRQKIDGRPFGAIKKVRKIKFENFETVSQCRKLERGTLWAFWNFGLLQNIKKLEGGPFGDKRKIWKFFEKNSKKRKMRILKVSQCRKTRKGNPLCFLKLQFAAKYQKTWRGDRLATKEKFENFLKIQKKNEKWEFWKSHNAEKNSKGGPCSPVRFCILR